jgi:hypothetical protein
MLGPHTHRDNPLSRIMCAPIAPCHGHSAYNENLNDFFVFLDFFPFFPFSIFFPSSTLLMHVRVILPLNC